MARNQPIYAACYDIMEISRFCRSVALMQSYQAHTKIKYEEWKLGASLVGFLYAVKKTANFLRPLGHQVFEIAGPGELAIDQASDQEITDFANRKHAAYLTTFLKKTHERGPQEGLDYLRKLERVRAGAKQNFESTINDISEGNEEILEVLKYATYTASRLKLTASVVLAGAVGAQAVLILAGGAAASLAIGGSTAAVVGAQATALSTGYGIICSCCANLEEAASADVVAVTLVESTKAGGGVAADYVTERITKKVNAEIGALTAKVGAPAARGLKHAARGAQYAAPVIFAAADIWSAFDEHNRRTERLFDDSMR